MCAYDARRAGMSDKGGVQGVHDDSLSPNGRSKGSVQKAGQPPPILLASEMVESPVKRTSIWKRDSLIQRVNEVAGSVQDNLSPADLDMLKRRSSGTSPSGKHAAMQENLSPVDLDRLNASESPGIAISVSGATSAKRASVRHRSILSEPVSAATATSVR